jgi:hyperosmotically inducible protein
MINRLSKGETRMKSMIAVAVAAAFAVPAYAQTTTQDKLPSAQERAQNRESVQEKLPNASERAQNRDRAENFARASALTGKVKSALAKEQGFKTLTRIDVDSTDAGVVTLKGKVESAEAKKKAEAVAKQVDGVKSVKNQLTVEKKG